MKNWIIFLCITVLFPTSAFSAPSISGPPSGTVAHGNSIVISGTGFGTKSPAAPLKWDNFEAYTVGNSIFSGTGFTRQAGDGVSTPYIRNDQAYGQGAKSARMDYYPSYGAGNYGSQFPQAGVSLSGNPLEVYMSYKMRFTRTGGTEQNSGFPFKLSRGNGGEPYTGTPRFYKTIGGGNLGEEVTWGNMGYVTAGTTTVSMWEWPNGNAKAGNRSDRWDREEFYYRLSNPAGTANGAYLQSTNGNLNTSAWNNVVTRPSGVSTGLTNVITVFDGMDQFWANYSVWMDDFYLDITRARVEICTGSTWANKGPDCEIQIPTTWSTTSIGVTVNQGAFATGSTTRYLYIVDSTGAANVNGQAITFGSSGGDTTAPSIPANLTANVIGTSQINLSWSASTDNSGVVSGYKVYRNGVSTPIGTPTGTTFNDTGLSPSTSYTYRVSALDPTGNESAQSSSVVATTTALGTVLFTENFEDASFSLRDWYGGTTTGTLETSGCYNGNCAKWTWATGGTLPTNGDTLRKTFKNTAKTAVAPTDKLYVSFYAKFQSGWRGSGVGWHPLLLMFPSNLDVGTSLNNDTYPSLEDNYLQTYVQLLSDTTLTSGNYLIRPQIALQDALRTNTSNGTVPNNLTTNTENRSANFCNTPIPAGAFSGDCYNDGVAWNSTNTWKSSLSINDAAWHKIEVFMRMNTVTGSPAKGNQDGIMQVWVDGVLYLDYSNILYRTAQDATKKWAGVVISPKIGVGSPIDQSMWIDDLTVGTDAPTGAVNGSCGSVNNTAVGSLTSSSPDLCSVGNMAHFTGTGPWSWDCLGTNNGTNASCSATLLDTATPVRSAGAPSGILPLNTTSTNMTLTTDEAATCKYSTTPNIAYGSMTNLFTTTGGTSHSRSMTGLVNGGSYNYYVRCNNATNYPNLNDFPISFSVAAPVPGDFTMRANCSCTFK